ncbi:MAG: hypothetical protein RMM08_12205, partial [Armatimonadota bacterium]|nr:hypothetical protein [bacterium]MDW8322112.1 hypothetical protein [Armatimonadota bacterium]
PVTYEGLRGQGTITCLVDAQTGFIHHIEYRYLVAFDKDAWLNIAIGERWDNSRLSKPPPSTRFRFEQVRGATRR